MADKEYTDSEICLKCVDENEILYDESGKYVKEIFSTQFDCSETFYHDILRNLTECKDVLLIALKQRIILNESRVRFNARNDIAGLQAQITEINLPKACKNNLQDISHQGYKILKQSHLFDHLVEFDAEQFANIRIFGRKEKMTGKFDMLGVTDEMPKQRKLKHSLKKPHATLYTADIGETDSNLGDNDEASLTETNDESLKKVVVTVAVTARNYVSMTDIFKQFLFMYLQNISRFYLLVFHIGPLVEKQEVVLYEYKPPNDIVKLVKSFHSTGNRSVRKSKTGISIKSDTEEFVVSQTVQKSHVLGPPAILVEDTESHDLDVSQLEAEFRKVKGQLLQQTSPLREYFRYMVYDCPGVKDHQKDNRARYDRYIAKSEKKKELKQIVQTTNLANEATVQFQPDGTVYSNMAEFASTLRSKNVEDGM